jgi:diguanylate cyclase
MKLSFRNIRARQNRQPKLWRFFGWTFVLTLICGAIEFAEPLEDLFRGGRDAIRMQSAPSDIVVIGVDDKTGEKLNGFGYSRSIDARLVTRLLENGAKRVYFDRAFADNVDAKGDAEFAEVLSQNRDRVFIGAMSALTPGTNDEVTIQPAPIFRDKASIVSLNGWSTPFGLSAKLSYGDKIAGRWRSSMSAHIANVKSQHQYYRPDWSISYKTIPTISMIDALEKPHLLRTIRGKVAVVGPTARSLRDLHNIAGQGQLPGAYFHVIGAQTLFRNTPINIGWLPGWILGLILSLALAMKRRRIRNRIVNGVGGASFAIVPFVLDLNHVTADYLPGIFLFGIVSLRIWQLNFGLSKQEANAITGLRNLVALRHDENQARALVALALRNYAHIASSMDDSVEQSLFEELSRRVASVEQGSTLYYDDGMLFWFSSLNANGELIDHLDGLGEILRNSIVLSGQTIDINVSFGVDASIDQSIDRRLHSVKNCALDAARAGEKMKLFSEDDVSGSAWKRSFQGDLNHAISTGQLWVAYQPKYDIKTGKLVGAEALARWVHPERGAIPPQQFVDFAEQSGAIDKLTYYILDIAMRDAAKFNRLGKQFSVSVNISVIMFRDRDFVEKVQSLLRKHDLQPERLILEITETGQMESMETLSALLLPLTDIGVGLSIDDYGTGNATLDYLKLIPAREIKIDKRFVTNMQDSLADQVLVRSTIEMAHALNRVVVAEGVETQPVLNLLTEMGCDQAQGFLLGRPMDVNAMAKLMRADTRIAA